MSENTNRINRSVIDSMPTADLEAFLELDMQLPDEKQSDAETLLYVTEVLAKRQDACVAPKSTTEAFDEFQRFYLPAKDDVPPLYGERKKIVKFPKWIRAVAAAVAIVIVLISGGMTAKAMGFDLWGLIVKWSDEIFFLQKNGAETVPTYPDGLEDLVNTLESYNVDFPVVPHWLPEGYSLENIKLSESPKNVTIYAEFVCGENSLVLNLRDHRAWPTPHIAEKDFPDVEEYRIEDCVYYLFMNSGHAVSKWMVGTWECSLYGAITIDELKYVIASFYEGE